MAHLKKNVRCSFCQLGFTLPSLREQLYLLSVRAILTVSQIEAFLVSVHSPLSTTAAQLSHSSRLLFSADHACTASPFLFPSKLPRFLLLYTLHSLPPFVSLDAVRHLYCNLYLSTSAPFIQLGHKKQAILQKCSRLQFWQHTCSA